MNKSIKKVLVTGASLLMLASAGAGISNVNVNARSRRTYRVHRHHSVRRKGTKKLLKRNHHYNKKIRKNTKKRGHKNYLPRTYFGKWYARRGYLGVIKQSSGSANISKYGDYINLYSTMSPYPMARGYMKFKKYHRTYSDNDYDTYIKLINHGKTLHVVNDGSGYPLEWYMHRI